MTEHMDLDKMTMGEIKDYVRDLESLCHGRDNLLNVLPECPVHGKCVPYAESWIKAVRWKVAVRPPALWRGKPIACGGNKIFSYFF